ncbi:hypothetical protein QRZ28_22515 [Raoultella ornithinolytica]|uniref:hypothetical protein n=1 Tax=Raoultella ornithinolytica TaxID=54291 RepID=UPI000A2E072B|nr:hypothetical protein [Raoultella ornithinolytica]MDL4584634.1 hypothetical protein [Raoultella ornithinolytica]SMQ91086.1 Uncharacterised protein [Raoultella ornithinolytica]
MDQKFKDEFMKVGITEHLLPVIERMFSHTAGRYCEDFVPQEWSSLDFPGLIYYPLDITGYYVVNPGNQSDAMLNNKEFGAFVSMMTINNLCWKFENTDYCEKLCDLYYQTRESFCDNFKNPSLFRLID